MDGFRRASARRAAWLAMLLFVLGLAGCAAHRHVARPGEDPYDRITIARLGGGNAPGDRRTFDLLPSAYRRRPLRAVPAVGGSRPGHIHPKLIDWIRDSSGTKIDTVLVSFRSPGVRIPRFPEPDMSQPRTTPINVIQLNRASALRDSLLGARNSQYAADSLDLTQNFGAGVLERFWLAQVLKVTIPLDQVGPLSDRHDVLYIEPVHTNEPPPQGGSATPGNGDEVADGRRRMVSDPYYAWPPLQGMYGWMSLLDTGVQFSHELLQPPVRIGIRGDCVNARVDPAGKSDCVTIDPLRPGLFNPGESCAIGHGTSAAAIIVGSGLRGNAYRGVTGIQLDCFRVFDSCPASGSSPPFLNSSAALHAFQDAVGKLDRVVCANIQTDSTDLSAISIFADNAFDAGHAVIAANGNKTNPSTGTGVLVKAPAYARKVLGVGGYDVMMTTNPPPPVLVQTWGPTADGRAKPDIMVPTNSETAYGSSLPSSPTGLYWTFTGTSGGAPYAAGAAALLRNWLKWAGNTTDPGQIYAQMILSGRDPYPFNDPKVGVGPIELPTNGWCCFGKVALNTLTPEVEIPLNISGLTDIQRVEAALWWPEELITDTAGNRIPSHNVIYLHLVDPNGVVVSSTSFNGVFQRTSANNTQDSFGQWRGGTWKLRISAELLPLSPQDVYWTVALRR